MSTLSKIIALVFLTALLPLNVASVIAQSGVPACSNTLPTMRPCNVGRACTAAPREDGACGSYVLNNDGVSYPQCTTAEAGDHCVLATNTVICGQKRQCNKVRKLRPVEEWVCESGGGLIGYIRKNVAAVGGDCIAGEPQVATAGSASLNPGGLLGISRAFVLAPDERP